MFERVSHPKIINTYCYYYRILLRSWSSWNIVHNILTISVSVYLIIFDQWQRLQNCIPIYIIPISNIIITIWYRYIYLYKTEHIDITWYQFWCFSALFVTLSASSRHTHTGIYIYIYIYIQVCVRISIQLLNTMFDMSEIEIYLRYKQCNIYITSEFTLLSLITSCPWESYGI